MVICWVDEDCVVVVVWLVLGKAVVDLVVDFGVVVSVVVSVLDSGVVVVVVRIVVILMGGLSRDD